MIGVVSEVNVERVRAFVVEPVVSGASTLLVTDGSPFAVVGAQAVVGGGSYGIASVLPGDGPDDPDMLVLDGTVAADVEELEPVDVLPEVSYTYAVVELPDGSVEERVLIDQDFQGKVDLRPGAYEGDARPVVALEFRDGQYVVVGVDGRGADDGAYLDPDTVPDPAPVTPDASPALTVTGTAETLVIEAAPVHPSVLIEYHVSTDPAFEPTLGDAATRSGLPTRATVYVLTETPDGNPLALETTYYVRAIAYNDAGTAAPSPAASGVLNPDALNQIILARLVAGFILTGRIEVGGIVIDANDGILIPQPDGRFIAFPADGSPADIAAHLMAYSLTVRDALTIQGISNLISAGAGVTVASGVSAPRRAPTVERHWPNVATAVAGDFAAIHRGLCLSAAGDTWIMGTSFFGVARISQMYLDGSAHPSGTVAEFADFHAEGGITRIGSNYYVLGVRVGGPQDGRWFVKRLDSSFVETGEWEWIPSSSRTRRPAIGTDGTNVVIAWANTAAGTPRIVVRRFAASSGADVDVTVCEGGLSAVADLTSVHWGSETGATRIVVTARRTTLAYNTGGTRQAASEWIVAGSADLLGMGWDGTRFRHLDDQGRMWTYSTLAADTARSIDYSWYDSDPAGAGTHETDRGPALSFTQIARSYLRVQTDDPYDTGLPDDSDSVRIWIDGQRQTPDQAPGATSRIIEIPTTGTTTKAASFASAGTSSGLIESAEPVGWKLWGDGRATQALDATNPTDVVNLRTMDAATLGEAWRAVGTTGNPAFQNGWVNFGSGFNPAGFRRVGNVVHLRGMLQSGTANSVIFTLPAGYRPVNQTMSTVRVQDATSAPANGATRLNIYPDGTVFTSSNGQTGWINIDGAFAFLD